MADKVYNISDYRKGVSGDTVDNIRIEDPLDFLDASEKEAYIRERHKEENEKLARREAEEKKAAAAAHKLSEEERTRIKRETDDPLGEKPVRKRRTDDEEERRERPAPRRTTPAERRPPEPDDDYDDDEEEEDDSGRGILIASGILGILIVLVLVFMLWLRFFMPVSEEPEAEERAIQAAETEAEEEEQEIAEEESAERAMILAQGFTERDDVVVTTTALNMRSAPDSAQDNKVTTVAEGTALTRVAENTRTGWSAVRVSGYDEILYCSTKYLKTE